jgi:hypothetical protein
MPEISVSYEKVAKSGSFVSTNSTLILNTAYPKLIHPV